MKKRIVLILLFIICSLYGESRIGVVVNKFLINEGLVRNVVERFVTDLNERGIEVPWLDTTTFYNDNNIYYCRILRDSIWTHYTNDSIEGVVLIGNLPFVMYEEWAKRSDGTWVGSYGPCEYYFMDLDEELDTAWHDNRSDTPFVYGYYDFYSRDYKAEIWVSRVIGHNFYYNFEDPDSRMREDSVIVAYFNRLHDFFTGGYKVQDRALLIGDFQGNFKREYYTIEDLGLPYSVINYPYDTPRNWERNLSLGYKFAFIVEHSSKTAHTFARDHLENNGKFISSYVEGLEERSRTLTGMILNNNLPKIPFFYDDGCSNTDFSVDNSLGAMYGMLGSGLVCIGNTIDNNIWYRYSPLITLKIGKSFGEAFKVSIPRSISGNLTALIGVGVLSLNSGVCSEDTIVIIDSVKVAKYGKDDGYYINGDTLILRAYARTNYGDLNDDSCYKWYSYKDSMVGREGLFILEGYDITPVGGTSIIDSLFFNIGLHIKKYQNASLNVELPGWGLGHTEEENTNFYKARAINSHDFSLVGTTSGLDDFIYYYRYSLDKYSCYEVSCNIKSFNNISNSYAHGGIIVGNDKYLSNKFVSLSMCNNDTIRLIYERDSIDRDTVYITGYTVGNTWLKIRRIYKDVYAYVSNNGFSFDEIGRLQIREAPSTSTVIGFFFSNGEKDRWDPQNPQEIVFSDMSLRAIDAIIDTIEPMELPSIYAIDSIKIKDRSVIKGKIGANKDIFIGPDGYLYSPDTTYVCGNLKATDRAIVESNLKLSGELYLNNNAKHIGELVEHSNIKFDSMVTKNISYGTNSIIVYYNRRITADKYKNVIVKSRANLTLSEGSYFIKSLIMEPDAKITLEGDVSLEIDSIVSFGDRYRIISNDRHSMNIYTNASNVIISEHSGDAFNCCKNIYAPKGEVLLKSRTVYYGSIKGKKINIEPDVTVTTSLEN